MTEAEKAIVFFSLTKWINTRLVVISVSSAGSNENACNVKKCVSLGDAAAVKQSTSGLHGKQY